MTELHPDRLLEGGAVAQHTAAQRRQGTTPQGTASPRAEAEPPVRTRPRRTPRTRSGGPSAGSSASGSASASGLDVRTVVVGSTAPADAADLVEAADAQALAAVAAAPLVRGAEALTAAVDPAPVTARRTPATSRVPRRRPALYLAAALAGAVGLSTVTPGDRVARAQATQPVSHSVSVAEELGVTGEDLSAAAEAATLRSDAVLLGEVTASRTAREAEDAAAAQVQADADRVASEAAAAAAAEAARPRTVLPVAGGRLTSTFGPRWGSLHAGIDLAAPMLTPEYAAADGVVLEAGPASGYGNVVYIQHENGDVTVYGHMEQILVQPGQVVRAGDTIALLGNRGQSTGPHLHFEVRVGGLDGQRIDPVPWLRDRGVAI